MYLAKPYNEYVEEHSMSIYSSTKVTIPRPELYVVYTGERKTPPILKLSDMYEGAAGVEVEVKVLQDGQPGDILSQYVDFCQVSNEQVFAVWAHRRGARKYPRYLPGSGNIGPVPKQPTEGGCGHHDKVV